MKKLFAIFAFAALLSSCGVSDSHYYTAFDNRTYNNPDAEFDTLSYAVGMSYALSLKFQYGSFGLPNDLVISSLNDELQKEFVDMKDLEGNFELMKEFMNKARERSMAQRRLAMGLVDSAEFVVPELYSDGFTPERVAHAMGRDMAKELFTTSFPVNRYWLNQAINDVMALENQMQAERDLRINPGQMMTHIGNYMRNGGLETVNAERTERWLANVAQMPDVNMLNVEGDTLYYRVAARGSERHPQNINDTVTISYAIYTCRGTLIESTAQRLEMLYETIEQTRNNEMLPDSIRTVRLAAYEEQIEETERPTIPLNRLAVIGARYAMSIIGEGGKMTIWMPASLAYGSTGNRTVQPGEGVVMDIELYNVEYIGDGAVATPAPVVMPLHHQQQPGQPQIRVVPAPVQAPEPASAE